MPFAIPFWLMSLFGGIGKAFSALFTFLTTKPGVYVLAVLIGIGALWYSHHSGYSEAQTDDKVAQELALADAQAKAAKEGMETQRVLDANLVSAAEAAGFARGKAQAVTLTITKEVPRYVTVETDRTFPVPCGLVRLHNAAADGVAPETESLPSGLTDADACPLKASDLAQVIVENYGLDHEKDAQIMGLQDLARALKETIEGEPKVKE